MFRYDGTRWVLYKHKITYTQTLEVYDDVLNYYPADAVVEDITLTPEQIKRLEAVMDEILLSDLTAFVMDDADIPGMESYRAGIALETLIDELPDTAVEKNLDTLLQLAKAWEKDTHYLTGQRLNHKGKLYQVRQEHTSPRIWRGCWRSTCHTPHRDRSLTMIRIGIWRPTPTKQVSWSGSHTAFMSANG